MKYMPHIVTASPTMNILHKNSTSVAGNKPIVAHHYLPEFIVYIRVHFWCCKFFGLLQMYAMCPPLQYHAEQFHCLQNPLYLFVLPLTARPQQPLNILLLHSFALSRMSYRWNRIVCSLFELPFLNDTIHLQLPCWFRWLRICLQCRRCGIGLWVGKMPWRREWLPTQVFLPGYFI